MNLTNNHTLYIGRIGLMIASLIFAGCQDAQTAKNLAIIDTSEQSKQTADNNSHNADDLLNKTKQSSSESDDTTNKLITTDDGKLRLNWAVIDSKTARVDADNFQYPFGVDSQPVLNYANNFNITAKQAQYAMMLSMASPEALGKIIDQLGSNYLGHTFQDGANPALIIQTTPAIVAEKHDYVIADSFAQGLVLPIEIVNKN